MLLGFWGRLKYRYAGKEKRVSLGVYPEVNLKKARARTIEARQLLDAGVDPSESRRAAKAAQLEGAANSFEVVAREWIDQQMKSWDPVRTRYISLDRRSSDCGCDGAGIADDGSGASKSAARWRPRTARSAIAARCFGTPSPPAAPNAIRPAICAAPFPRSNLRTLPP
jgi:hypothetical protein